MLKKSGYILLLISLITIGIDIPKNLETKIVIEAEETSYIDSKNEIHLSKADEKWALETVRSKELTDIPKIFLEPSREIFITIDGKDFTAEIETETLAESLIEAAKNAEIDESLIQISILNTKKHIPATEAINAFERGLHGISIGETTLLPHTSILEEHETPQDSFEALCEKAGLEKNCTEDLENKFFRFTTYNFTENPTGEDPLTLSRYNTETEAEDPLALASERLKGDLLENGQFHYLYYPSSDSYASSYNIIRHILGSYTLIELSYLEEAEKSIDFFMQYIIDEEEMSYITYNDKTKLGSAAVAVLTLLSYQEATESTNYDETIEKLTNFIIHMQNEDGGYRNYYPEEDPENTFSTVLYTGESNLALTRLFAKTGDTKYLETIEKSYDWVESYFDKKHAPALVSWNSMAFSELYPLTEDQKYIDLAFEMTDWLIDTKQYTEEEAPYPIYIGSFIINDIDNGLTCSAAAYAEGILSTYELAEYIGDQEHQKKYKESLDKALGFIKSMQFTEENSFYMENPEKAIGGFRASPYNHKIRVDFTSHAIAVL